jgi:ATP citrate (pro-S)-lyase
VEGLKKQGKRVPGIGHRIKSKDNRDKRVELLSKYARRVGIGLSYVVDRQSSVVVRLLPSACAHLSHAASGCMQLFLGTMHLDYATAAEQFTHTFACAR